MLHRVFYPSGATGRLDKRVSQRLRLGSVPISARAGPGPRSMERQKLKRQSASTHQIQRRNPDGPQLISTRMTESTSKHGSGRLMLSRCYVNNRNFISSFAHRVTAITCSFSRANYVLLASGSCSGSRFANGSERQLKMASARYFQTSALSRNQPAKQSARREHGTQRATNS